MKQIVQRAGAFLLWASFSFACAAQDFPSRPIKMEIAFAVGGATDVLARLVSERLSARLGRPVVPENRPGAATAVAAALVARAKPDGYTLLFSSQSHAVKAATDPDATFDAVADFAYVGKVGQTGLVLVASPELKVHDLNGLLALGRSDPMKLKFASSGTNTSGHLWTQLFFQRAGVPALHVPYNGEGPAIADLMAGNVNLFLCTFNACGGRLHDGKMTPLVVTTAKRYSEAPEVPTLADAGFPGTEMSSWYFIAAPKGTPPSVVQKLNEALNDALADGELRKRAAAIGIELETKTSPASLQSLVQAEIERWRAAAANIRQEGK